jgi:autotransporter strand-loop-strand O-heptosyltransferase
MNKRYLREYYVEIWDGENLAERISFLDHIKGKRVFITFDSSSLGDNIAWVPYCLEFKKRYDCEVIVSTFKNFLFKSAYPEMEFVERGVVVDNIVAMYNIGWFNNQDMEPVKPSIIPLQQTATNILHLPYEEIKPRLVFTPGEYKVADKYVAISMRSTAQCKHWYYWQELVYELRKKGYKVIELSQGEEELKETIYPADKTLENVMQHLYHADFYIGLSSGISWLAWAMNKPVVMISNFTNEDHEFECIRITNKNVCHGCWNNPKFLFNKGDWNWCPEHEHTDRQFECHKSISVEDVMEVINPLLTHT